MIQLGSLCIDACNRRVIIDQQDLDLTSGEFDLLLYLVQNAGKVLSRDKMCTDLRGVEYDGIDRSIDIRVSRLRKKLNDESRNARMIKSIRGVGYLFAGNPD